MKMLGLSRYGWIAIIFAKLLTLLLFYSAIARRLSEPYCCFGGLVRSKCRNYFLITAYLSLCGCVPWIDRHPVIKAPNAVYYNAGCSVFTGSRAIAYYPFHGIFISLAVGGTIRLGVHVPRGYTVQIDDPFVKVSEMNGRQPAAIYAIRAFRHGVYGDPKEFHRLSDPYTTSMNFGPLDGEGQGLKSRLYLFLSVSNEDFNKLAQLSSRPALGAVTVPAMTINGERYEAQTLQFAPKAYFEIVPLNC